MATNMRDIMATNMRDIINERMISLATHAAGRALSKEVDPVNTVVSEEADKLFDELAAAIGFGTNRKQQKLGNHSATSVVRWMGKKEWTFEEARAALNGVGIYLSDTTIRLQLLAGERGERGKPARLGKEEQALLASLA